MLTGMEGSSPDELVADCHKTEAAVLEHLDRLYAGRDSARLCLCSAEARALFSSVEQSSRVPTDQQQDPGDLSQLPACPELQAALGPGVVAELCRVLGALHSSLAAAKQQAAPGRPDILEAGHQQNPGQDALLSPDASPQAETVWPA